LTQGKTEPVSLLVAFERGTEKELSVVEVGIRLPQEPPAEVKKAWLPVATQVLSKKLSSALGLKGKKGVRITQVFPESAAEQAGFKVGDVITHVDDQQVEASEPHDGELFESMIWAYKVGSAAEFTVLREGKPLKITATLGEAPKAERELRVYEDLAFEFKTRDISYLDRVMNRWSKDQGGALVSQVDSGGWAAVAGLRTDDLIQSVDGQPVSAVKDLEDILGQVRSRKPKQVVFFLKRGIYTQFVEIEPTWREKP
jgi:S1-C subfamily serine protease